jgi:hypothetical protein
MKTSLIPLYFAAANERERQAYATQLERIRAIYGDVAEVLPEQAVGEPLPAADAVLFPQLIGAAFGEREVLARLGLPLLVITSEFGTVEMWDWEIVTFLRDAGCQVFSPYTVELGKTILRAIGLKRQLAAGGAKFLLFQDSPGEGMQANIFKRFYWWEQSCTAAMAEAFNVRIVYRSWKEVAGQAQAIPDGEARQAAASWDIAMEDVAPRTFLSAVKLYLALKAAIDAEGDVAGVGSNCLNESFSSDSTPCLAWAMLFERERIIWACEGDTVTLLSKFLIYRCLESPLMMSNIYPFLMGMAAIKHEKIDRFPAISDPDNHALLVHCGYLGCVPRAFCSSWVLRPKVLAIVDDNAIAIDARLPEGPATLVKLHPNLQKLIVVEAEIEGYVQYPGSDCRNGMLVRFADGHQVMRTLTSHHTLILTGKRRPQLEQVAAVFGWQMEVI